MNPDENTQPENVNVAVHLDILGVGEAVIQTVGVGVPGDMSTIILRADPDVSADLAITATIGAELGQDLGGIEVLATIAEAFHRAVQQARTGLVERLIQPTPPESGE